MGVEDLVVDLVAVFLEAGVVSLIAESRDEERDAVSLDAGFDEDLEVGFFVIGSSISSSESRMMMGCGGLDGAVAVPFSNPRTFPSLIFLFFMGTIFFVGDSGSACTLGRLEGGNELGTTTGLLDLGVVSTFCISLSATTSSSFVSSRLRFPRDDKGTGGAMGSFSGFFGRADLNALMCDADNEEGASPSAVAAGPLLAREGDSQAATKDDGGAWLSPFSIVTSP